MIADSDRLNSKMQGAVVIDLAAVRRQRDMAQQPTTQPVQSNAPKQIYGIIIVLLIVAVFFRLIRVL